MAGEPNAVGPARSARNDLIGIFVRHRTAANLLMILMILIGVVSLSRMNTQFFPDFGIDFVTVQVEWRGASAEDVDTNIVQAIEPEVRFLDGVKQVRSTAQEGFANVYVEFLPGSDMQLALSNVETAVGQVTTLPDDSERPEIRRVIRYDPISRIVISGPYSEAALKAVAKRVRDDLLDRGIDKVNLLGSRDEEIWVEVPQSKVLELDMTLEDIARRIGDASQDLPSGDTSGAFQKQIRSIGLEKEASGIARIEVKSLPSGQKIHVDDVARTSEQFDENQAERRRNGQRAIELQVQRSLNADALELADIVNEYLADVVPTLPPLLKVEQYNIQADLIRSRVNLLLENGLTGLVLVVAVLFVFLNSPVAFWVAMGIPVSLMATMGVMLATGQTVNMISLFGMIMALGIVVDDAIVVGEHADALHRKGLDPVSAAENGARRMAAPVFSSSLTTIAAFAPLLFISDIIGDIIAGIPYVVIAIIIASLVECFLALPGHLRGAFSWGSGRVWPFRTWFNARFDEFRENHFRRFLRFVVRWRYAAFATAIASLIVSVGILGGGRVQFSFFPSPEADIIYANVQMVSGTSREQTIKMVDELEWALNAANDELAATEGSIVVMNVASIGASVGPRDGGGGVDGDNAGGIVVELKPSDERTIRTSEFVASWREKVQAIPGLETMTILPAQGGPPGRPVDVRLSGDDLEALKAAANEVRALLARYPGVTDIEDDLTYGKQELILELSPQGKALGFSTDSVGRQVRHAFDGATARRFARGDEEVTIRVRFPRQDVDSGLLADIYVRSPVGGVEVPLDEVVQFREKQGFARIKREDGQRQVAITAEIDAALTNSNTVLDALQRDGIYDIAKKYSATASFAGKAEEQEQTLADMRLGAIFGMAAIFIILAWVFGSYSRPFVVMAIIPLSFVGATLGHLLLGFDMSILSLIALVGLAGIVVNDSIILVTTIDERIRGGEHFTDAVINGTCDRLRAVILTSLTTIGGLTPLLFERSFQAQFLVPMAITLVFGLMITTFLVLLVIPSMIAVQGDLGQWIRRRREAAGAIATPAE